MSANAKFPMGENITAEIVGTELVLRVNLAGQSRPSSTGKTRLQATTGGALPVNYAKLPGLKVAINVTIPA